jgi:hypothetical protein
MQNNTGSTINYFQVAFTGEQWRQNTNSVTLKFYYQVNAPDISNGTWTPVTVFDFTPLHTGSALALDGNLAVNDTSFFGVVPVTVASGQEIWFKWEIIGNSSSPGLAIDDLDIIPYTNNPTGTASSDQINSFNVFYSASLNSIFMNTDMSSEKSLTIHIFNIDGKEVNNFTENFPIGKASFMMPAGNLTKGIYFLSAEGKQEKYVAKILIY